MAMGFCCGFNRSQASSWRFSRDQLYPALYRLEHQGAITSEWGESENNRRAKYYRLTAAGRAQLRSETEKWNRMAGVIAGILKTAPGEI
jgi:PadR family transcriptional regulator PadR